MEMSSVILCLVPTVRGEIPGICVTYAKQKTNGPVNAHLISWPSKAQNIQNLENKW